MIHQEVGLVRKERIIKMKGTDGQYRPNFTKHNVQAALEQMLTQ